MSVKRIVSLVPVFDRTGSCCDLDVTVEFASGVRITVRASKFMDPLEVFGLRIRAYPQILARAQAIPEPKKAVPSVLDLLDGGK